MKGLAKGRTLDLVVGMVEKKDHEAFFRELRRVTTRVRIAPPSTPRAAERVVLEAAARRAGLEVRPATSRSQTAWRSPWPRRGKIRRAWSCSPGRSSPWRTGIARSGWLLGISSGGPGERRRRRPARAGSGIGQAPFGAAVKASGGAQEAGG
ncbi:MAG: hypothetical protein R3E12_06395 [Candidatus Eisenbacteria bacterium]